MENLESISDQQRQAIEAAAAQVLEDHAKVAASTADYENSAVTASLAVGTDGGGMQGNVHYTRGGEQIYFSMEGKPTSFYGLFAGPGTAPFIGSLPAARLSGQIGTFKAWGGLFGGFLQLWLDGQPVWTDPLPLAGPGTFRWGLEGRVKFVRPS